MNIHEFLSHFDNVKGREGQWMATCPCHDDKIQSLSIGYDYRTRKILLFCHAGCITEEIVKKVGLKMPDLSDEDKYDGTSFENQSHEKDPGKSLSHWKTANEIYVYRNGNRKLKWLKENGEKICSWDHREKDGMFYKGRNCKKNCLYVAGNIDDDVVIVVEGEKDAERVHATTPYTAVCNEHGADREGAKWLNCYTRELEGKIIYIVSDNDDVGHEFANHVCEKLCGHAKTVNLLDLKNVWPEIPDKGDYSDMCCVLGDKEGAARLGALIDDCVLKQTGRR